jgi:RNA polymerase sigma factor (sigma-70 family)
VTLPPFQAVLDEHGPAVLRLLRRLVGPTDAEDDWQETFIAALRAYPRLRPDSDVRAWLLTIAHRKAIDHHRARSRRPLPVGDPPEQPAPSRPDRQPGIWRAVAALPPKQRAAVALRFACDLPHREIGAAIGISEAAARRNVYEGVKRLRLELA